MPRPKGSKNKTKTVTVPTTDFAALIAEKAAAKESLTADITALEENLETIKADLKASKCLKTWRSAKRQFSCYNAYIIV